MDESKEDFCRRVVDEGGDYEYFKGCKVLTEERLDWCEFSYELDRSFCKYDEMIAQFDCHRDDSTVILSGQKKNYSVLSYEDDVVIRKTMSDWTGICDEYDLVFFIQLISSDKYSAWSSVKEVKLEDGFVFETGTSHMVNVSGLMSECDSYYLFLVPNDGDKYSD